MASAIPSTKAKDQAQAALDKNKDINLIGDNNASHGDDAAKKITGQLRNANKHEVTFTLTMQGDPNYGMGKVVALDGSFGLFAGNYLLDKCVHRVFRQGYQTEIEGHKCLTGHDAGSAPNASGAAVYTPGSSVNPSNLESGSPTPLDAQLGAPKTFLNPATGNLEPLG